MHKQFSPDFEQLHYTDGLAVLSNHLSKNVTAVTEPLQIGVDEAGRGPLLGPVAVSAVILDSSQPISGLADSKKLSEKKRNQLFEQITEKALAFSIIFVSPQKIDDINILQATLWGMKQSVCHIPSINKLPIHKVLIDGNKTIEIDMPCEAIVGGDAIHENISAASILAKVARDRYMYWLHDKYPSYAIDKHKGYPTKLHKEMLLKHGILAEHRRSFKPISLMV